MVKQQPKDYAVPTTSYEYADDYNIITVVVYCSIAFISACYFPTATLAILAILKVLEFCDV